MFEYDKVYDRLFENEEFVEILCSFHSSNWDKLNKDERKLLINLFINKYVEILEIDKLKFKKISHKSHSGSYNDASGFVNINGKGIENGSQYDLIDTLFHELRHNFQHRAISKNLTKYESVDDKTLKLWKLNFFKSPRGYSNYIDCDGEDKELYIYQPVEKDAFMTGLILTKKAYSIISGKLGKDDSFEEYSIMQKNIIMTLFSQEKRYVASRELGEKRVLELFERNNEEKQLEEKCFKVAQETMKKEISDMSEEEIISLFSVYVWVYLEDDYKIELLQEYDRRVNKGRSPKICLDGNSMLKISDRKYLREDVVDIINSLYTIHFRNIAKLSIKGKIKIDEKMKEDLAINLYSVNKKDVNYIDESDNFLLYSIQPFALFEGKVIIEWFKKIRQVERDFYGVDSSLYDYMVSFYDYDKYIPFIEDFYGMPFEDVYNELLEKMKNNIKSINKGTR